MSQASKVKTAMIAYAQNHPEEQINLYDPQLAKKVTEEGQKIIKDITEKICIECGREKRYFMHNCNRTHTYAEIYGCPKCDDHCGLCDDELDRE